MTTLILSFGSGRDHSNLEPAARVQRNHCDHELAVEDPAGGWAEEDEKAKEKEERPAGIKSETCGNGMKTEN